MKTGRRMVAVQNCLLAVLCVLLVAGCSTAPPYVAKIPAAGPAMVSGNSRPFSFCYLCQVDGYGLGRLREWHFNGLAYPGTIAAVPVNPGRRKLTVYCEYELFVYYGWPLWGSKEAELTVDLLAGHHYQIQNERDGRHFILWLEDTDAHECVGEKKTVPVRLWLPVRF